ncbi:hypothetical protein Hypma_015098 [Hypsizygus marmoreus]|uniref:Uncharacterized protein n=1 Tax=Hypsizygus marmoreus TaxID=39966 RepID=A0A369K9G8_HYPMA|nr:hypothetical protein Hypma_015098 [Hypsizygus marmoreus]
MWCTRWFLPLLLLPLPTAPPYFLLLFLFSLTMHAKPCFYCIVLLSTLFVSSCYWQPFPLDSPLSTPWAENITTFAEALNATLTTSYSKPLPDVMRVIDRCWCDFSAGGLFEPFNTTQWEYISVQRLKDDLERQQKIEEAALKKEGQKIPTPSSKPPSLYLQGPDMPRTSPPKPTSTRPHDIKSIIRLIRRGSHDNSGPNSSSSIPRPSSNSAATSHSEETQPLIRKEYDLRPYGVGILVDFGWTR